jgi:DNA-binding transcriptional MerR regulator
MSEPDQTSFSLDDLSNESGIDTRVIRSFIEQGLMRGPTTLGRYARYSRHHLERLQAIKVLKEKQGLRISEVRQQLMMMSDAEIAALAETGSYPSRKQGAESALDYIMSQSQQFMDSSVEPIQPSQSSADQDELDVNLRARMSYLPSAEADLKPATRDSGSEPAESAHTPLSLADSIRVKLGFKARTTSKSNKASEITVEKEGVPESTDTAENAISKNEIVANADAENEEPDYFANDEEPSEQPTLEGWGPAPVDEQKITRERLATPVDRLVEGLKQQVGAKSVRRQAKREAWHRIQVTPDIELSVRGIHNEQQLARLERVADYLRELLTGGSYD